MEHIKLYAILFVLALISIGLYLAIRKSPDEKDYNRKLKQLSKLEKAQKEFSCRSQEYLQYEEAIEELVEELDNHPLYQGKCDEG